MTRKRETKAQRERRLEEEREAAEAREDRVSVAVELLLRGSTDRALRRHARAQEWPDTDEVIADARDEIQRASGETREQTIARHIESRRMLYRLAVKDGDHRTAAAVLKDEGDLLGLYRYDKRTGTADRPRPLPHWQRESDD